jgi:CRP/FNR family cyclic AMP-dependent transcriptional regulator
MTKNGTAPARSNLNQEAYQRLHAQLVQCLPAQLVDELLGHHTTVTYSKTSIIFLQGSPADLLFWILSGLVKTYCPTPDGKPVLARVAGPGDIIGYADIVGPDGRNVQAFEARAINKCRVALFTREHVMSILQKLDSEALVGLLTHLNTAWSSWVYRLANFSGLSFRGRLDLTLKELASRFGVRDSGGTLLRIKLSHADLAEMIEGSRPMATRLIREMVAEGSLIRRGKEYSIPLGAARAEAQRGSGVELERRTKRLPEGPRGGPRWDKPQIGWMDSIGAIRRESNY